MLCHVFYRMTIKGNVNPEALRLFQMNNHTLIDRTLL